MLLVVFWGDVKIIVFFLKKNLQLKIELKYICTHKSGSSSVGRAPAFQAGCREFEPRLPLQKKPQNFCLRFFCFYFRVFSSVSGSISIGSWFCLNNRAVSSPFNFIESPLTSSQLPSLNPKTGCGL